MSIKNKYSILTQKKDNITEVYKKRQIGIRLKSRPLLKSAYDHYQKLINIMEDKWHHSDIKTWIVDMPDELPEFDILSDIVELFGDSINNFTEVVGKAPCTYSANVARFTKTISEMPFCIYDVLRTRILFSAPPDTIMEGEIEKRINVLVSGLINILEEVTGNIKEDRYYGL